MHHSVKTTKLYSGINAEKLKNPSGTAGPLRPSAKKTPGAQPSGPFGGITREQKIQLESWADQRDVILKEISVASDRKNKLIADGKALATANTDLSERNLKLMGSIEANERTEKERGSLLPKKIAELEGQKTTLETKISNLSEKLTMLTEKETNLKSNIATLTDLHDRVYARASVLDQVVGRVTKISEENMTKLNIFVGELGKSVSSLIGSVGDLNVTSRKSVDDLNRMAKAPKADRIGGKPGTDQPLGKEGSTIGARP